MEEGPNPPRQAVQVAKHEYTRTDAPTNKHFSQSNNIFAGHDFSAHVPGEEEGVCLLFFMATSLSPFSCLMPHTQVKFQTREKS